MDLKDFQKIAINKLSEVFLDLWKTDNKKIPLIFKAPTGSGKTIMMAEFLRCLDTNFQFSGDKAYIWISFGGDDSYSQSKNKLYTYFNEGTDIALKDISNLNESKLYKNNVFFINWAKIKASNKEGKKLRKETETTEKGKFDDYIENTKKEREIILIVDEAHREAGERLPLYNEIIDLLEPRIIIKITATPEYIPNAEEIATQKAGYVGVLEDDVIESGLIKEQIIIQTEEEINNLQNTLLNEDEKMLELAFNKREELKKHYENAKLNINPLVLIQLPNDFNEKAEIENNKKDQVLLYLKSKEIKDTEIAIWLSNEKVNLEKITDNTSEIKFMLFKEAPATGWDCPRADVLVMFREIHKPSFHTQIIGRIKRMPEAKHYKDEILNKAYLYTNYNKKHIKDIEITETPNKIPIYYTKLKETIIPIEFESSFISRVDFNTLEVPSEWQKSFFNTFHKYFGTSSKEFSHNNFNIVNTKIDLKNNKINNTIIVNAKINSFDSFTKELKEKGKDIEYSFSDMDIEKLYNLLCFEELKKQEDDKAKYNPSRSWSSLKKALNVYFREYLGMDIFYPIIINELSKTIIESELKKAIYNALVDFRPIHDKIVQGKDEEKRFNIAVPAIENSFTSDYMEIHNINKNAYKNFYLLNNYPGRENEVKFINFLEHIDTIEWWHKQGNIGKNNFAIKYYNSQEQKENLFYPDFIIKTLNSIYILDTKGGIIAKSQETADKNKALQEWIKSNQHKYKEKLTGGIVVFKYPNWFLNQEPLYIYEKTEAWKVLEIK
jgi:type III restriction enzyme